MLMLESDTDATTGCPKLGYWLSAIGHSRVARSGMRGFTSIDYQLSAGQIRKLV